MACSLTYRPTHQIPLVGSQGKQIRQERGAFFTQQAIEHVQRQLPALGERLRVGDFADARAGWISGEQVVVNLRHADVTTPFHEFSHLATALAEAVDPEGLDELLLDVMDHPVFTRAQRVYADRPAREQALEALQALVQGKASELFVKRQQRDEMVLGRFWNWVEKAFHRLTRNSGGLPALAENGGLRELSLGQAVNLFSRELVLGNQNPDVDALVLQKLFDGITYDQQQGLTAQAALPETTADFLELISGKESTLVSRKQVSREAQDVMGKATTTDDRFILRGKSYPFKNLPKTPANAHARLAAVMSKIRELEAGRNDELLSEVLDFFGLSDKERRERVRFGNGDDEESRRVDRSLAARMNTMLPDFNAERGDRVFAYAATGMPAEIPYSAAFDNGNVIVHEKNLVIDGKKQKRYQVSIVSSFDLNEDRESRNLLAGIYNPTERKTGLGAAELAAQAGARRVRLNGTYANLQKMQAVMLGMWMKKNGLEVDAFSVSKLRPGTLNQNQVHHEFPVTELLESLRGLRTVPAVRNWLNQAPAGSSLADLASVLDDGALYDPEAFQIDWMNSLQGFYHGNPDNNPRELVKALGEYRQRVDAVSSRQLVKMVQYRMQELKRQMPYNEMVTHPEYLMLSRTLLGLHDVRDMLNPYTMAGGIEKWYTSMLGHENPFIKFWRNRFAETKIKVNEEFRQLRQAGEKITQELISSTRPGLTRYLLSDEARYYTNVRQRATLPWLNPKTGQEEQVEILLPRFVLPGSAEFQKLNAAEQQYIRHQMQQIATLAKRKYQLDNSYAGKEVTEAEAQTWYDKTDWAQGMIPMARAGVQSQLLRGNVMAAADNALQQLLDYNPLFEPDDERDQHKISEMFSAQGTGEASIYGNDYVLRRLGIEVDPNAVDENGQPTTGWRLQENYQALQAREVEGDLRLAMDLFTLNMLKHHYMRELEPTQDAAIALMRFREDATGVFERASQASGSDKEAFSSDEEMFVSMIGLLLHNRRDQIKGEGAKAAAKLLNLAGGVSSFAMMAGNLVSTAGNNLASFTSVLTKSIADRGAQAVLDIKHLPWALKEIGTHYNHVRAIAVHTGAILGSDMELLFTPEATGRNRQLIGDLRDNLMLPEKISESWIRMVLLLLQLKKDKSYGAYRYDGKTGEVIYSESKDRELRGDAVVDAIRREKIIQGTLLPEEKLTSGIGQHERQTMAATAMDVLGGYEDLSQTYMDTKPIANNFTRLRQWMLARVEGWTRDEKMDDTRVIRDNEGNIIPRQEVGSMRTMLRLGQAAVAYRSELRTGNFYKSVKGTMRETDRANLKRMASGSALSGALYLISRALWPGDDEKTRRRLRANSIAARIMDSVIQEHSLFANVANVYSALTEPSVALSYMGRWGIAGSALLTGDLGEVEGQISRLPMLKMIDAMSNSLKTEEELKSERLEKQRAKRRERELEKEAEGE